MPSSGVAQDYRDIPALGMWRARSGLPPRQTERKRSPEQPGPQGNAQRERMKKSTLANSSREILPRHPALRAPRPTDWLD
jgi:hypothetical protein